ncbi:MAG: phage portal protein [candidate division Zixibacteria bacterium]|nr:phage portal protein [candidate division Zixibacteria bacterium]
MPKPFKMQDPNFLDKTINFIAPTWGMTRQQSRMRSAFLNTLEPLDSMNRSNRSHTSRNERAEDLIKANDRKLMQSLVRIGCYENPILKGMIDRMVNNVIPPGGLVPNAITEDDDFNAAAEEYYNFRSEAGRCEITGRFDDEHCQRIALRRVLADGGFGSILTNQRTQQLTEATRILTPLVYQKFEGTFLHQGVRINDAGRPITYYIGGYDRYGNIKPNKFVGIQARNFIHLFHPDRVEQYRGVSAFLPSLQNLRDVHDILKYEKFSQKMAACVSIKIKPAEGKKKIGIPFPTKDNDTAADGKNISVKEMFPGQIFDLAKMGAEDVIVNDNTRTGDNFDKMITLLSRLAGVGVGLPIELVLLDFHRGNMSSIRSVMLEARKVFFEHYGLIRRYADRRYRWILSQGVKDGILNPPASIANNYWKVEWTEPIWNYYDPLKEMAAEGMAIALGVKTHEMVAKQRGGDWAQMAIQLGKEYKAYIKEDVPIVIGDPGSKTIQELLKDDESNTNKGNNNE